MSLANIRRLLQEDTVLRLPAIVAYAAARKQVVSIVALQTCLMDDNSTHAVQICMLHVNTQGKLQWTHDTIAPTVALPSAWLRQNQIDEAHLSKSPTWRKGWAAAIHHMAKNNILVVSQAEDFAALEQQFLHDGSPAPEFTNALSLRGMFHERHPSKSSSMKDIAAYYQVYLDPEKHLKAVIVTYAKLFEKMLSEQSQVSTVSAEHVAPEVLPTESSDVASIPRILSVEDARKWVVRAEAGASTPLAFFTQIAQQFPFRLMRNGRRIQGYALLVNGEWIKGTQLSPNLGWVQICQDHHWRLDDTDAQAIEAIQYKDGD